MEPIEWILALTLLFGGYEHFQKEAAQDQVVDLEVKLEEANEVISTIKEVNETNADTIDQVTNANNQCIAVLEETKQRQAGYAEINRFNQVRIQALESLVDNFEWSDQPIPSLLLEQLKD